MVDNLVIAVMVWKAANEKSLRAIHGSFCKLSDIPRFSIIPAKIVSDSQLTLLKIYNYFNAPF